MPNRLAKEKSPYLLQHANNPVDWYPWGDEAFSKAKEEDKPIFLSIGYSTCHWCHVMEHESFEDEDVAALMNEAFVNIKLDREERPDIDHIYMTVTQMVTGHGGWPMTIVMTPDKKPFFAGTYFPKNSIPGRMGMMELVPRVEEVWKNEPEKVIASSEHITNALIEGSQSDMSLNELDFKKVAHSAYTDLVARYDRVKGGFSKRPKFPTPHNFLFLLRFAYRTGEDFAKKMVLHSLKEMRMGGIFDQIGYGFHRYSTDENWLLPHFEKMLYDQALLIMAYTEAYQISKEPVFKKTAQEIIEYVLRDLGSQEGGFYSAEDADSEGEEGKFYIWDYGELRECLGDEDAKWIASLYQAEAGGNFLDEASGQRNGSNIFYLKDLVVPDGDRHEVIRQKLMARRSKRIRPLLDDKILTDWNGLMISALAKAGRAFDQKEYIEAAEKAVEFLMINLVVDGKLLHRFRDGDASFDANLEDFAFLTMGMIDLYQASFNVSYLEKAISFTDQMVETFEDSDAGAFFLTSEDVVDLIIRPKESYDGAIPSGNSVAMLNLLRLSRLTGNLEYDKKARQIATSFGAAIEKAPSSLSFLMMSLEYILHGGFEISLVGENQDELAAFSKAVNKVYLPNAVLMTKTKETVQVLRKVAAFTSDQNMIDKSPTAYICRDHVCNRPVTELDQMMKELS